jgi:hypothetical protein
MSASLLGCNYLSSIASNRSFSDCTGISIPVAELSLTLYLYCPYGCIHRFNTNLGAIHTLSKTTAYIL